MQGDVQQAAVKAGMYSCSIIYPMWKVSPNADLHTGVPQDSEPPHSGHTVWAS